MSTIASNLTIWDDDVMRSFYYPRSTNKRRRHFPFLPFIIFKFGNYINIEPIERCCNNIQKLTKNSFQKRVVVMTISFPPNAYLARPVTAIIIK